jgi:hypothetical protein
LSAIVDNDILDELIRLRASLLTDIQCSLIDSVIIKSKYEKSIAGICEEMKYLANILDASNHFKDLIDNMDNSLCHDFTIHNKELYAIQRKIEEEFRENKIPDRGFVYVAYRERPRIIYYVGKASSIKRLDMTQHGKLLHSLEKSTSLGLLFPGRSSHEALNTLEASVIALVKYENDKHPIYNRKNENTPGHECGSGYIKTLSDQLNNFSKLLNPYD